MSPSSHKWSEEELFSSGDIYFTSLFKAIEQAQQSIDLEFYIFEHGLLGDRMVSHLIKAQQRGVQVRLIIDGWGSPNFAHHYWKQLKQARVRVRFFRVSPWILKALPGDAKNIFVRFFNRLSRINRGMHRKLCLIDGQELWLGSFNVSDVHLTEVQGDKAWKDVGVRVRGEEIRFAKRAFVRAYRGWAALNLPLRSPKLLLLNDSYLHKRRTRLQHIEKLKSARETIWLATPYFVPIGRISRLLAKRATAGLDVRLIVPSQNDVWIMKWMSIPLLKSLSKKGVKIYLYQPRFSHQKVLITDDFICIGSTNLNHRSFLHDLEMDVVITHSSNKAKIISSYLEDQALSVPFDSSDWAKLPFWQRILSSFFLLAKYWA